MTNTNKLPDMPTVIEVDGVEYDLTKLDQPFGDLPMEVRIEMFRWYQSGGDVEAYIETKSKWFNVQYPSFSKKAHMRISLPRVEPEYPWEILQDWVQWCAVDDDGEPVACEEKPGKGCETWLNNSTLGKCYGIGAVKFERGNLPWSETLRKRPEGV